MKPFKLDNMCTNTMIERKAESREGLTEDERISTQYKKRKKWTNSLIKNKTPDSNTKLDERWTQQETVGWHSAHCWPSMLGSDMLQVLSKEKRDWSCSNTPVTGWWGFTWYRSHLMLRQPLGITSRSRVPTAREEQDKSTAGACDGVQFVIVCVCIGGGYMSSSRCSCACSWCLWNDRTSFKVCIVVRWQIVALTSSWLHRPLQQSPTSTEYSCAPIRPGWGGLHAVYSK